MTFKYENQQFKLQEELKAIKEKTKRQEEPKCELCRLDGQAKRYFESTQFVVLEHRNPSCLMVVFKKHVKEAWPHIHKKMVYHLTNVANKLYGKRSWVLDTQPRDIENHVSYYARKK